MNIPYKLFVGASSRDMLQIGLKIQSATYLRLVKHDFDWNKYLSKDAYSFVEWVYHLMIL